MKTKGTSWYKVRVKGLRRRWFINAVGVLCALGFVCILAVVSSFSAYWYSAMESDMTNRAQTASAFFAEYLSEDNDQYYHSCVSYARNFRDEDPIVLQFLDTEGTVVASSYAPWEGKTPATADVGAAISQKEVVPYRGKSNLSSDRILAVSAPMINSSGEVVGVLRYVTPTDRLDRQITTVSIVATLSLVAVLVIVLVSSNAYIRSVLVPLADIIEKSKKIAGGSYGIQIQTKYDDEIGELADTINEMSNQISQNEKIQTEFISSLSHELRTPLTAITGWSETLLTSDSLDADTRRGVRIIQKETARLTEMVVDLLDFTRIQDDRMTLNIELADIRSEFEDTVYMYGSRLSQDGIKLIYHDSDEEIPEISCDPKRMRQVFLNILDNAAKHGADGKKIDAAIGCEKDAVVVRIRDYGPGIPEDELPLVKKKFYKGSSKARGTGIGLAVCDEIVERHGGTLTLENAPGGGTLVKVQLPISQ